MEIFKTAKFDNDALGDSTCKELFSVGAKIKKKSNKRVKKANSIEKAKNKKHKNKKRKVNDSDKNDLIRQELQRILNKSNASTSSSKINDTKFPVQISPSSPPKNQLKKKKKVQALDQVNGENNKNNVKKVKKRPKKKQQTVNKAEIFANTDTLNTNMNYSARKKEKLKNKLKETLLTRNIVTPKGQSQPVASLRERMMQRLKAARFRFLNEQIYSTDSREAQKIFSKDPDAFKAYHQGYRQQVDKWPLNPLDVIIDNIKKMPKTHVIADFGCGEARLATSVQQKVHSFDLVASSDLVTACDMAHVPLPNHSVDVAIFCLSLMGTNLHDYIREANRVLKVGGILKIAEVESRFDNVDEFVEGIGRFQFKNTFKDLSHNLFYFLDFKKESNIKNKKKLPTLSLHPCLYKKR